MPFEVPATACHFRSRAIGKLQSVHNDAVVYFVRGTASMKRWLEEAHGAFSHSPRTAPITKSFIPGTPLKTTPLQKRA